MDQHKAPSGAVAAAECLDFWFTEHGPDDWYSGDAAFDVRIADRFSDTHRIAEQSGLFEWRTTPEGRVAELIVLDQFSRQLYRGQPRAFASDGIALALAQELHDRGLEAGLDPAHRQFALMPFMHSELLSVHDAADKLFRAFGNDKLLQFAKSHRDVIARFGRYPMRNAALGRASTPEEETYIASRTGRMF